MVEVVEVQAGVSAEREWWLEVNQQSRAELWSCSVEHMELERDGRKKDRGGGWGEAVAAAAAAAAAQRAPARRPRTIVIVAFAFASWGVVKNPLADTWASNMHHHDGLYSHRLYSYGLHSQG